MSVKSLAVPCPGESSTHGKGPWIMRKLSIPSILGERPEASVVWFASSVSVLLTAAACLPDGPMRLIGAFAGLLAAAAWAPAFVEHATPVSVVRLTMTAAAISIAAVLQLSGASFAQGLAASRVGFIGKPYWWLFSISCWSLAVGLLAVGSLMLRRARRSGRLTRAGYRAARALPAIAFAGFAVVGALPLGLSELLDEIHDQAAIFALGAFWLGMTLLAVAGNASKRLRAFSAVSSVTIIATWLPTELKRVGLIATSPVKTLHMQAFVFLVSYAWLAWLAREWGRED